MKDNKEDQQMNLKMGMLNFKKQYILKFPDGTTLIIDPIDRIRRDLKLSTFRLKEKPLKNCRIRQGNYKKKESIIQDIYLEVYKIEFKSVFELTPKEIRLDIGLTKDEFEIVLMYYLPNNFFFEQIKKIDKKYMKESNITDFENNPVGYLIHFQKRNFQFETFNCHNCKKDFQILKSEVEFLRNDFCESCIDKLIKKSILKSREKYTQSRLEEYKTISEKRLIQGF